MTYASFSSYGSHFDVSVILYNFVEFDFIKAGEILDSSALILISEKIYTTKHFNFLTSISELSVPVLLQGLALRSFITHICCTGIPRSYFTLRSRLMP
jgi:hypothetical protein